MRGRLAASLAGLSIVALTGCSLMDPVEMDRAEEARALGPDAPVIRMANGYEPSHPVNSCGAETMREELRDAGIDLQVYPSGQLGSEAELVEQVATGALDVGAAGSSFLGVWHEDAAVLDAGYLFRDVGEFNEATQGPVMEEVYDEMAEETGLRVMSSWYYGTRQMTANRPIREPEDLRGLKIRTPDAPLYLTNLSIMGATPTPMALSEVYLGLQQNAIDAQENPIPTISSANFDEVQDYLSLTGHMVQGVEMVTSENVLGSLDPEQREALERAMDHGRIATEDCVLEQEREIVEEWRADGSIQVVDDVDVETFQAQVARELPARVEWGDRYLEILRSLGHEPATTEEAP